MRTTFRCPICESVLNGKYRCVECKRDFAKEIESSNRGELTEKQIAQQDFVDNACYCLLKEFRPRANYRGDEIGVIRDALIEILTRFYNEEEYDIYPWLLEPEDSNTASLPAGRVFEINSAETLKVRIKLSEKVSEGIPPMEAEVVFQNGSIEIKVPEVETYNEEPGEAIPILIEQAHGKLFLRAWDNTGEDPVINKSWDGRTGGKEGKTLDALIVLRSPQRDGETS